MERKTLRLHPSDRYALQELLLNYRLKAELSQLQLADRSGVGIKTICSFERNSFRCASISLAQLLALLRGTGVPFEVFAGDLMQFYGRKREAEERRSGEAARI